MGPALVIAVRVQLEYDLESSKPLSGSCGNSIHFPSHVNSVLTQLASIVMNVRAGAKSKCNRNALANRRELFFADHEHGLRPDASLRSVAPPADGESLDRNDHDHVAFGPGFSWSSVDHRAAREMKVIRLRRIRGGSAERHDVDELSVPLVSAQHDNRPPLCHFGHAKACEIAIQDRAGLWLEPQRHERLLTRAIGCIDAVTVDGMRLADNSRGCCESLEMQLARGSDSCRARTTS